MATRVGFSVLSPIGGKFATTISSDLNGYAGTMWPPGVADAGISRAFGPAAPDFPVSSFSTHLSGWRPRSYFDDFYNRIHIRPRSVALGNVLSEQVAEVEVWNAWLVSQTLNAIDEQNTEGLTLIAPGDPPQDPPTTFNPLEERTYLLSAATTGPSAIDGVFTWQFGSGESISVTVTGARVVVWPFRPNWSRGVLERINYVTDVQVSDDDSEQRDSISGNTWRRQIEFTPTLYGDQFAAADALLWGWQSQVYGLPVWWDISHLAAPVAAGAMAISCDTTDREFVAGGLVILTTGDRRHATPISEAGEIDQVLPGQLLLIRPLQNDWPAGAAVCPGVLARLPAQQAVSRITAGVGEVSVLFSTEDEPELVPAAAPATYQGIELDLRRPLRSRPVDAIYARRLLRLDNGFGPVVVDDLTSIPQVTRQHDYRLRTRAEQQAFKGWLRRRRGQHVSQWTPTWQTELRPVAQLSAASSVLQIAAIGAALYNNQPGRRHLLLEHRDGTQWQRDVISISTGAAGREDVLLDSPLGVTVEPGDWKRVCWLERVRQAGDSAEINHQTAEVAQATVGLRTVRT